MQIILMQKVVNLGNLGDVVKVKEGYARNYLIPHGKAKRVTEASLAEFEVKRTELERVAGETLAAAQDKATKMEGLSVTIARKAGVDGRLFGSVSNADIADALAAQGFEVAKSDVRMPNGQLKMIGEVELTVSLHTDVTADIKVVVVGE
jgi:large subunit ribosomal protein L9